MAELLQSARAEDVRDSACDTWLRTIALLGPQHPTPSGQPQPYAPRAHAPIVTIIERLSTAMAVVSWRDATHCRYGAQVWTIGTARDPGQCALSGAPIDRNDLVFRPQRSRPPALNADAMILASAMDDASAPELPAAEPAPRHAFHYRSNAR
ncbi:DUF3331 domain-containing protein [Cupriavidus sp. SZY C1]|uniref:DUF3331 domain-containing protein n=1 Tax=Cupriavidus sp. SZY C1 TaxID=3055037 RepID=UPI0028B4B4D9|nr:DUF3331 domain-containing protein [Cupriavidus sp. SZY C1]MDT6964578.1 DUF3331 domain-containing protein [Cupriavidus sp. SZY C1]